MKYLRKLGLPGLLFVGVLALSASPPVFAAGTASDTNITNTATLNFDVGGVGQTPVVSAPTTFKVDNKVDATVAKVTDATVIPASTDEVLVFTVTNIGNTTQGYSLAVSGGTDDIDMNNVRIYLDVNADGLLDGGDTLYVAGTNVADVVADNNVQILVVADTPATATNGQTAIYNLIATTLNAGTTTVTPEDTGVADNPALVQVVWADGAGTDDAATDGKHSADGTYTVSAATVTVTKTSVTIRDPFSLGANPKAIPGAWVQYTITIANAAAAAQSATLTTITDALNANTAIDPDLIVGATGLPESALGNGFKVTHASARPVTAATQYFTTASDADGVEHAAGTVTATLATVLPVEAGYAAGELKPGESVSLIFNVVIQ